MKLNRESYNKIVEQWAKSRNNSFLSKVVIDFASKMKSKGKVLDIGCGTGYPIAKYLSEQGFHVTGIDISEKLLQKAIDRNLPNTNFYLCDFFDFLLIEKFDGIIAFDSFFHFPKERQKEIYLKVSGWMNKGAYLLFTHGNVEGEIKSEMFGELFYYGCLNTEEVHKLLFEAGIEIEWSIEDYQEKDSDNALVVLARKL